MSSDRISWLDALRGLGLIFVILGHMTIPGWMRQWIFSFHMPLFFFLSGYLFRGEFSLRWCLRKFDSLLIPYFVYGILTLCVWRYVGRIGIGLGLKQVVEGNGLGVTWFLSCMLLTELLGAVLVFMTSKWKTHQRLCVFVLVAMFAGIGSCLAKAGFPCYYKSTVVPAALVFWLTGWLLRGYKFYWYQLLIAIIFAVLFVVQKVDMASASYGNPILFFATACGYIVLLLWFFNKFQIAWWPLVFIGERSLEFMCWHALVPMLFTQLLFQYGFLLSKPIQRVCCLLVLVVFAALIHRYSLLLSGRLSLFQRCVGRCSGGGAKVEASRGVRGLFD